MSYAGLPSPRTAAGARRGRGQAGYSLVELGIVVAVVGIMVSGLIYPVGSKLRQKTADKVAAQMSRAVDAIVGYAVINRTPGALYRFFDLDNISGLGEKDYGYRVTRIPAGRPYLPCPDINGDGVEDRSVLQVPVVTTPQAIEGNQSSRHVVRQLPNTLITQGANTLTRSHSLELRVGRCVFPRGTLPWRTLGLEPTDPWYNRYTYYVSDHFSTALFGFDQLTRSSNLYDLTEVNIPDSVRTVGVIPSTNRIGPLYVCDPGVISNTERCSPERDLNIASQAHTRRTVLLNRNLDRYLFQAARTYGLGGAFDGLPFAIISHGPNGQGAMPRFYIYSATQCKGFPAYNTPARARQNPEAMNAAFNVCSETTGSTVPDIDDQKRAGGVGYHSFYQAFGLDFIGPVPNEGRPHQYAYIYARDRVNAVRHEQRLDSVVATSTRRYDLTQFDDSVAWLTRRELVARMINLGVLPVAEPFRGFQSGFNSY